MHEDELSEIQQEWHGSYKGYFIGFLLSLLLTTLSFTLAIMLPITGYFLSYTLAGLALLQAIVQLIYFLHLGTENKPRWETWVFLFMVLVLLIIVTGSLWIIHDLNQRVMPDMEPMIQMEE